MESRWRAIEGEEAAALESELRREIAADHVLSGHIVRAVARRDDCDVTEQCLSGQSFCETNGPFVGTCTCCRWTDDVEEFLVEQRIGACAWRLHRVVRIEAARMGKDVPLPVAADASVTISET